MNQTRLISHIFLLVFCSVLLPAQEEEEYAPWPIPESVESGYLKVSDIHELYYEVGGNPEGIPLIMLHGGPGGQINKNYFAFADPEIFRIVLFDQRGAGKSKPVGSIENNTTWHLVEDINKLRDHLGITKPAVLWGVSWGSTLGLAYAEKYPELTAGLILVSTFTALNWEIDHIYHGGAGVNYPENYAWLMELVKDPHGNVPAQYFEMITGDDAELAKEAAIRIAAFEIKMIVAKMDPQVAVNIASQPFGAVFAKISTHYMMNHCFVSEGQLLRDAHKIKDIPVYLCSGRMDPVTPPKASYDLAQRLENVLWEVSPGDSHNDQGVFKLARKGAVWMYNQLK